jgi:cyclophilin family peptidyl-prolyl cis-trans isomerase/protein-disulfide isomerase
MSRLKYALMLTLSLALAACQGIFSPTRVASPGTYFVPTFSPSPPECTVISEEPTPGPTGPSLFLPVRDTDWVRGPQDAAVTILEYSDFQCEYCAYLASVLERLVKDYPDQVRVVFRPYPLIGAPDKPLHDKAALALQAALAAGDQDRFWEMHDLLYGRLAEWTGLTQDQFIEWLTKRADELDLDVAVFAAQIASPKSAALAQAAWDEGQTSGIPYAPFVVVNGQIWAQDVPLDYTALVSVLRLTLLKHRQYTRCPPQVVDQTKRYYATLHTAKGDIVIELFADKAPLAVNNFVFLAQDGWFDGVTFHRVLPGFVAQTGDPSGSGYGSPGYAFDNEIDPDLKFDAPGVVAMANAGPGSNGSQFFITYAPIPRLDGGYTIFGRVISGMDVVESLTPRDPSLPGDLPDGDRIEKVIIEER